MDSNNRDEQIKEAVRQVYGNLARRFDEGPVSGGLQGPQGASCCGPAQAADCCGPGASWPTSREVPASCRGPSEAAGEIADTAAMLYSSGELAGLPASVTWASAGCGNPTAIAELRPGEVVLDLGSGGGIDCFLAARQVGPEGKVIGLDMTPDMIKLARRNARKVGVTNVDFRYGEMEEIPLPDESVDVIISNCVINLSPDKDAVFREAHRVLRPGGRMSVSDIVVNGELPRSVRNRLDAWASCIAGALKESVYLNKIRDAGFEDVTVVSRDYAPACQVLEGDTGSSPVDAGATVGSMKVQAVKAT